MLVDLLNRLQKIMKCPAGDEVLVALQQRGLMLEDGSWPFLQWNQQTKKLCRNARTPISMNKLVEQLTELQDLARDPTMLLKFQCMGSGTETPVLPWRIQFSMRHQAAWDLMGNLQYSGAWVLMGATMKAHSASQSSLASELQQLVHPQKKPKGRGKGGKGKTA